MNPACPACGRPPERSVLPDQVVPVNSMLLLDDRTEAESFPTGTLSLEFCGSCGFVWNSAFDSKLAEYSGRYEASQAYSERFNAFARNLAERWIETYDLRGKTILEIGADKGDFLALLCELGGNRGIGVDPASDPSRQVDSTAADRLTFVADLYDQRYLTDDVDVILCRHTLEHIAPVESFMRALRSSVGDRTDILVLFELPDVLRVLEECAFWDLYFEHCSYFTQGSLARLFRRTGFEILNLATDFDDQYLLIEARPGDPDAPAHRFEDDLERTAKAVETVSIELPALLGRWVDELSSRKDAGERTVIWGGGSKGVAFVTWLGAGALIDAAVDINPHKQGHYLAASAIPVVSPESLVVEPPDAVVVMNPTYRSEIERKLADLGLAPDILTV